MKRTLTFIAIACALQSSAQAPFSTIDSIDVNNINAVALVHGDMWWKPGAVPATDRYGCFFSAGRRTAIGYGAAMWLSGYDDGGNLHVSAQTYRQDGNDYWPGPLDAAGSLNYATSADWARIWKVSRAEVTEHRNRTFRNLSNTPASILEWPGKGNAYARGKDGAPLTVERDMAPFIDRNSDGIYQPLKGDYPDFKGDQALWWIFSDNGPSHSQTNGQPLRVEVKVTAYAYKRNTLIDNVVYYDYAITNRSSVDYNGVRWALWDDAGFENYNAEYTYFDSARRLGIIFHEYVPGATTGGEVDTSSRGVTLVSGPGDGLGSYVPAGSFVYYNNDPSIIGNPASPGEYHGYMHAKLRNGAHFSNGGADINYTFTEDPSIPGGHECGSASATGNRRFVLSCTDFNLPAGKTEHVLIALVADSKTGSCPRLNFDGIKATADTAWAVYHNPPAEVGVHDVAEARAVLSLFPNPAHDYIDLRVQKAGSGTVDVFDVLGVKVASATLTNGEAKIAIGTLTPGLYAARVVGKDDAVSACFMKQ